MRLQLHMCSPQIVQSPPPPCARRLHCTPSSPITVQYTHQAPESGVVSRSSTVYCRSALRWPSATPIRVWAMRTERHTLFFSVKNSMMRSIAITARTSRRSQLGRRPLRGVQVTWLLQGLSVQKKNQTTTQAITTKLACHR